MKLIIVFLVYAVINYSICFGQMENRKLTSTINPDCPPYVCVDDKVITVLHVTAEGSNNTLHYIWDFTGKPSILLALTPLNTSLIIKWTAFMENTLNSVKFSSEPIYTAALVLNKIYEFNDVEDTGTFFVTNSTEINVYDTQNFTWVRNDFRESVHEVEVSVVGDNVYLFGNGTVKLKFKCFASVDHDIDFPHLLHTENSVQFDFVLHNIETGSEFEAPRFAGEFILVADESKINNESYSMIRGKSLDDEHTPGIFDLIEIVSPNALHNGNGSYIRYRPVSYTHPERDVSTSTDTHISMLTYIENPVKQINGSLAWLYYGYLLDEFLVEGFNISFGMSGDGFYTKSHYNSWTFTMGYGSPPIEHLSEFVIIVAFIGFGLPLLLLIIGIICTILRRRSRTLTV